MAAFDPTFAETLWAAFKARLDSAAEFTAAPTIVVSRRGTGDPDKELDEMLGSAGKAGVAISIEEPVLEFLPSPGEGRGTFTVWIAEAPALNRGPGGTRKTAQLIESTVISRLVGWTHSLAISPISQRGPVDRPQEGQGMLRRINFGFAVHLTTT